MHPCRNSDFPYEKCSIANNPGHVAGYGEFFPPYLECEKAHAAREGNATYVSTLITFVRFGIPENNVNVKVVKGNVHQIAPTGPCFEATSGNNVWMHSVV